MGKIKRKEDNMFWYIFRHLHHYEYIRAESYQVASVLFAIRHKHDHYYFKCVHHSSTKRQAKSWIRYNKLARSLVFYINLQDLLCQKQNATVTLSKPLKKSLI